MSKRTVSSFQMTEADAKKFDALEQAGFGSRTDIIRIALDRMYRQEIKTMTSLANSAHSICNYCGAEYDAAYGHCICDIDDLRTIIHQEQSMTDEPDERLIAKLQERIREVKAFWKTHPNHQSGVSRHMSS